MPPFRKDTPATDVRTETATDRFARIDATLANAKERLANIKEELADIKAHADGTSDEEKIARAEKRADWRSSNAWRGAEWLEKNDPYRDTEK